MLTIRPERHSDEAAVRHVTLAAFGQPLEADLVDRLRVACPDAMAWVADDGAVVGHILFTPVTLDGGANGPIVGMGLAPMSVAPDRQRQGIGSALVRHGLDGVREQRWPFVVVVGHPEYYPRFGFVPASSCGLVSQWEGIPDEAFMVYVLRPDVMAGAHGVARYHPAFDDVV